ncbi:GNAT family N-acetyltransferase [uncultured Microscilla sp.]|uniref:GNAT family N-acetyltransferase n=1 Tax=uncultured Microscilla sp. TaxID=432653 RepID=UPI0026170BD9|nr:GNAT family N-acetyltransferase [uncultured Microscilla sp.]
MIRLAKKEDLGAINEIYNYEVAHSIYNVDTRPVTHEERLLWYENHPKNELPILVKEVKGETIAWASLSQWTTHGGYSKTAEVAIFVARNVHRQGLGKELLRNLIEKAEELEYKSLVSRIVAGNTPSIKLHQLFGFKYVGVMRRIAHKLDQWVDVQIWQKDLFI